MNLSAPLRSLVPSLDGDVLAVLAGTTQPMNAVRIASLARTGSVSGVRRVLERLATEGIARAEELGPGIYYAANRDHLLWPSVELASTARRDLEERIVALVSDWEMPPISTTLYGSVADGTATAESDVDLLLVLEAPDDDWFELSNAVERWTGNRAHLLILSEDELRAEAASNPALANAWRQKGRTLQGRSVQQLLDRR